MVEAHSLAANFYSHLLLNTVEGEKALQYLENRGFTRAISKNMESDGRLMIWSTINITSSKRF